jgi:hypothetical protein
MTASQKKQSKVSLEMIFICQDMADSMDEMLRDLSTAKIGNKAAAQRVRVNSIKFEKMAKEYRKESLKMGKKPEKTQKTCKKSLITEKKSRK